MIRDNILNDYFEWLYDTVCHDRYDYKVTFRKLLIFLHSKPFRYSILRDENRETDGISLRYRFALDYPNVENADEYIDGPCSVLEMMIALAIRCEETIMDDPSVGDRTAHWFWSMVTNLGLGSMYDSKFDKKAANDIVERFLDREYKPDGRGGLFTIKHCDCDLRDVEIWNQLCWFLDSIT